MRFLKSAKRSPKTTAAVLIKFLETLLRLLNIFLWWLINHRKVKVTVVLVEWPRLLWQTTGFPRRPLLVSMFVSFFFVCLFFNGMLPLSKCSYLQNAKLHNYMVNDHKSTFFSVLTVAGDNLCCSGINLLFRAWSGIILSYLNLLGVPWPA